MLDTWFFFSSHFLKYVEVGYLFFNGWVEHGIVHYFLKYELLTFDVL